MTPEQIRAREPREQMRTCEQGGGHEVVITNRAASSGVCRHCGCQLSWTGPVKGITVIVRAA